MGYQKDREQFIALFYREFPSARLSDCLALLREASAEQRFNEISSSIDVGDKELARLEKRSENRTARVRAICERIGGKLIENGDPRGYPYLIATPSGRTNDWGQRGIGIPGRGLPASAFR